MTDRTTPVTRRSLRAAERAAHHSPWTHLLGVGGPAHGRHSDPRPPTDLRAPLVRLTVCTLLLAGGVGHAQALRADHAAEVEAAALAAEVAEVQYEVDRQERVSRASSVRLTLAAATYAAQQLDEALSIAQTAADNAGTVVATAAPVVSAEQLTPLDAALADLTAIIESSPLPAEVAAPTSDAAPELRTVAAPDPTPATNPATTPDTPPAGTEPATSPAAAARLAQAPSGAVASTPTPAPTPAEAAPGAPEIDDPTLLEGTVDSGAPATEPRPLGTTADLSTLGLELSARLITAAANVVTLTSEVQAVTDATIAAAQAEAAAAAAEQAARERLAEQVAAADRAPNGAIPRDSLCGVAFTADVLLRCDAAAALEELDAAYRAHFGTGLEVVSTYRDLAGQAAARRLRGSLAAVPGTSNHGRGLAVDLGRTGSLGQFDAPAYLWLKAHAGGHGWHHPGYMEPGGSGPYEPWHWEFGTSSAD